jgi:hypothetical protein
MLFKAIRQWFRQLCCRHDNRRLDGIVREPVTYGRQASYHCPDCQRNWVSWNLPDSVTR